MTSQAASRQWVAETAEEADNILRAARNLIDGRMLTLCPGDALARIKLRATTPFSVHVAFGENAQGGAAQGPGGQPEPWVASTAQQALDLLEAARLLVDSRMLALYPGSPGHRYRHSRTTPLTLHITIDDSALARQAAEQHALLRQIENL
ncbi:hypothetical protein [Streptomyces hydrogenans]|uniref:hypothetical protein n=1 Tax=Streptomyces hydrogenans TaxID=1873719 RepID=UPI0036F08B52